VPWSNNIISWLLVIHWNSLSVLDSATGKPAEGVSVKLQQLEASGHGVDVFRPLAEGFDSIFSLEWG
jgi:hypothetical protein